MAKVYLTAEVAEVCAEDAEKGFASRSSANSSAPFAFREVLPLTKNQRTSTGRALLISTEALARRLVKSVRKGKPFETVSGLGRVLNSPG